MERLKSLLSHYGNSKTLQETTSEDGLHYRQVTEKDIAELDRLGEFAHFDIGIDNLRLYYLTSPSAWRLVENDRGEVIAYDSNNELPNGVIFGFQLCVRDDQQGKGLTSRFFTAFWNEQSPRGFIGNSSPASLLRYKFPSTWLWKINYFYGMLRNVPVTPDFSASRVQVERLQSSASKIFAALVNYDKTIVGFDRKSFLAQWTGYDPKNTVPTLTIVALDAKTKKLQGYGVIRKFSTYWSISPLYGDSEEIGRELLWTLVREAFFGPDQGHVGQSIYLAFPASSGVSQQFVAAMKLLQTGVEQRQVIGEAAVPYAMALPEAKIFAIHEYWPC